MERINIKCPNKSKYYAVLNKNKVHLFGYWKQNLTCIDLNSIPNFKMMKKEKIFNIYWQTRCCSCFNCDAHNFVKH